MNPDPTLSPDLSLERQWYLGDTDTDHEQFKPKRLPLKKLLYQPGFCDNSSDMLFQLSGTFQPQQMGVRSPIVEFVINRTSNLFMWQFKIGNKKQNHMYEMWSTTKKINVTNKLVNLTKLQRDPLPTKFNLTIECNFPMFDVILNYWEPGNDPNGISRNSSSWDSSILVDTRNDPESTESILVDGAMEVNKTIHNS